MRKLNTTKIKMNVSNPNKLRSKPINTLFMSKIPVCFGIEKEVAIERIKQQSFF